MEPAIGFRDFPNLLGIAIILGIAGGYLYMMGNGWKSFTDANLDWSERLASFALMIFGALMATGIIAWIIL